MNELYNKYLTYATTMARTKQVKNNFCEACQNT